MAFAFVLMVGFVLMWAETAFHLTPVHLPNEATVVFMVALGWAIFSDFRK